MPKAVIEKLNVVHPAAPKIYLALRLGSVYNHSSKVYHAEDPIKEIDTVLAKLGFVHFAKFGKSISDTKLSKYLNNNPFYLVVIHKLTGEYTSKVYKIVSYSREMPADTKSYPKYYRGKEGLVGVWFKLEATEDQVDIEQLRVSSSYQKLRQAMGSSMASFFFCKT